MDKSYIDRIRRALEPLIGSRIRKIEGRCNKKKRNLSITERIYPILWDQTFSTNGQVLYSKTFLEEFGKKPQDEQEGRKEAPLNIVDDSSDVDSEDNVRDCSLAERKDQQVAEGKYPVFIYYEGRCKIRDDVVAKFTASGDTLLPEFAAKLSSYNTTPEKAFFAIGKTIYLRSLDKDSIKFATMLFQLRAFDIKKWDVSLEQCIGNISEEIYFYDGNFSKYIQVSKLFFSHRNMSSYISVKHLQGQAQLCKCCLKSNAVVRVLSDPILPDRKKYICKRCFNLLLLNEDGNHRYDEIKYESFC